MSVSPISTTPVTQTVQMNKRESVSNSNSSSNSPTVERAAKIDQEATKLQAEAQQTLDHIQDQYQKEYDSQVSHQENLLESQRSQGYKQLRELQRAQQAELRRVQNQGESELSKLKDHFEKSKFQIENEEKNELSQLQRTKAQKLDFEKQKSESDLADLNAQYLEILKEAKSHSERQLEAIHENHTQEYEKLRSNTELAQAQSRTHFTEQYQNALKQQQTTLEDLETKATEQVQNLKNHNTELISTYQSKDKDPFYKSLNIDCSFYETDRHFILEATIPKYEQDHLSAVIQGNQLILSGTRRNQETLELNEGQSRTTSTYQTYSQTFPLSWPVDAKKLSRETAGDQLIIRVPKMDRLVYQKPTKQPNPRIPL